LSYRNKISSQLEQRKGQSKAEHDAAEHCAPECKLRVEARVSIRKAASAVRARTPMEYRPSFRWSVTLYRAEKGPRSVAGAVAGVGVTRAPRTRAMSASGPAAPASPRHATCWSGRPSTSLRP